MEYDHLTVFFGYTGKVKISGMVSQNHHLPWSIILLIFSVLLIGFGGIRKRRFISPAFGCVTPCSNGKDPCF